MKLIKFGPDMTGACGATDDNDKAGASKRGGGKANGVHDNAGADQDQMYVAMM